MTGNKKVLCKVCYKEMRSDNLTRHTKQHSNINKNNPAPHISVRHNVYNTKSSVSTQRNEEENESKDENSLKVHVKVNETRGGSKRTHNEMEEEDAEALKKYLMKCNNEYEKK